MPQSSSISVSVPPTTRAEQALVFLAILTTPLQSRYPAVAGLSTSFLTFVVLAIYVIVNRSRLPLTLLNNRIVQCCGVLLLVGFIVEPLHELASYFEHSRILFMVGGAIVVACFCRDRQGMQAALLGFMAGGMCMSLMLMTTSYGSLQLADASDFGSASAARIAAHTGNPLAGNLNAYAYLTGQGAIVAAAFLYHTKHTSRQVILLGIIGLCVIGTFLPVSRSGALILAFTLAVMLWKSRLPRHYLVVLAFLLAIFIAVTVPDVVWSRMTLSFDDSGHRPEGRVRVFNAAMACFSEYVLLGVGRGQFYSNWGVIRGFGDYYTAGVHNAFLQVWLYWGLLGVLAFCNILFAAYRSLPRFWIDDPLACALMGLAMSVGLMTLFVHNLYAKEFSIGLGLLIASRAWLWPKGIAVPRSIPQTVSTLQTPIPQMGVM